MNKNKKDEQIMIKTKDELRENSMIEEASAQAAMREKGGGS